MERLEDLKRSEKIRRDQRRSEEIGKDWRRLKRSEEIRRGLETLEQTIESEEIRSLKDLRIGSIEDLKDFKT